jgi:hypothetical protein
MNNEKKPGQPGPSRRSFLNRGAVAGAALGTGLMLGSERLMAQSSSKLPAGDVAILKFLAAAELVEDDLWTQYTELAMHNPKFNRALREIDPALIRYIQSDRDDERSHANLINAYLALNGEQPVNLDAFRTLAPSPATGAQNRGRLTNLTNLNVDTSWFNRYRGTANPDLGGTYQQFVTIAGRPTIPVSDDVDDLTIQAIANSAAFHFCAIEQGGGSLYNALTTKVTNLDVLAILASIGPTEVYHFGVFHTTLENLPGLVTDDGMIFPDLRENIDLARTDFPGPAQFLSTDLPLCSTIRPRSIAQAGAVAAATGLVNSGLFQGQTQQFLDAVVALATAADKATRGCNLTQTIKDNHHEKELRQSPRGGSDEPLPSQSVRDRQREVALRAARRKARHHRGG